MLAQKLLIIILMATKSLSKQGTSAFCVPRPRRHCSPPIKQPNDPVPSSPESSSPDINNQFPSNNDEYLKLKPEKESTSLANHEVPSVLHLHEPTKPLTRHTTNTSNHPDADHLTPEHHPLEKLQQVETSRRMRKLASWQELPDPQSDILQTVKKGRKVETEASPYSQIRKSYRKVHRREVLSFPFRKCHDTFQGRIVTLLNKMENEKDCSRDLENLLEKMGKMNVKQMMNKYVISGIRATLAMATQKGTYDAQLLSKLRHEEGLLQGRLFLLIDSPHEFATLQNSIEDSQVYRLPLIKKVYSAIKMNHAEWRRGELRKELVKDCSRLFEGQITMNTLVRFMRDQLERLY